MKYLILGQDEKVIKDKVYLEVKGDFPTLKTAYGHWLRNNLVSSIIVKEIEDFEVIEQQ